MRPAGPSTSAGQRAAGLGGARSVNGVSGGPTLLNTTLTLTLASTLTLTLTPTLTPNLSLTQRPPGLWEPDAGS